MIMHRVSNFNLKLLEYHCHNDDPSFGFKSRELVVEYPSAEIGKICKISAVICTPIHIFKLLDPDPDCVMKQICL